MLLVALIYDRQLIEKDKIAQENYLDRLLDRER
jgi:hypothetical protein